MGDFDTPLSSMDRSSRQEINQETQALDDTFRLDRPNSYLQRVPSKSRKHTFFSRAQGTFSRIDHMLGQKVSFHKFEKTEIISSIFYEIRNQLQGRKNIRNTNVWRLNNTLLNNQWNTEEIKEKIKKYLETNESEK